jgi:hypothetical protein
VRAPASDRATFLETVESARTFPDELWRKRALPRKRQVTFVYAHAGVFDAIVTGIVKDDEETVYLVGMWLAPDLRGSDVARELLERLVCNPISAHGSPAPSPGGGTSGRASAG